MIILSLGSAFYFGWALTLIILCALPCFILSGLIMAHVMKGGLMSQMKAYAQSSGYAEQALQAIKVPFTYGNELLESKNYDKYLLRAKDAANDRSWLLARAIFLFSIVSQLISAFAYYFGGYAITHSWANYNGIYTGGAIFTVVMSTV